MIPDLILPTVLWLPRKTKKDKRYPLNLNQYRNAKYIVNHQAKRLFKQVVSPELLKVPELDKPIRIVYRLVLKQKRGDVANVCSIVDKFFCDALVETGKIADDDYSLIPTVEYRFERVDKHYPCCIAEIHEND